MIVVICKDNEDIHDVMKLQNYSIDNTFVYCETKWSCKKYIDIVKIIITNKHLTYHIILFDHIFFTGYRKLKY